MNIFLTILDSLFHFFGELFLDLNAILVDLVDTFGVGGLIFAMVFQSIVAPIISEAVLTTAGYGFYETMGNEGLFLALLGGIIGSLLGAIIAFYIARMVQGIVKSRIVDVYASDGEKSKENIDDNHLITKIANILARLIDEDSEYFLEIIESKGFFFVLLGRLAPFIPFDAVSYGAGLTRISFWNYFIPTVVGTIPRVFFYVYLGAGLVSWAENDLNMFFLILLVFVVAILVLYILSMRIIRKRFSKGKMTKNERE